MLTKLFCSAGAMKAGTTWLHRQLVLHPDIFFTPEKEIHYLCDPLGKKGPMTKSSRIDRFMRVTRNLGKSGINEHVRSNLRWYIDKYLDDDVSNEWYIDLFSNRKDESYVADFSNLYSELDSEGWANARKCAADLKVIYTMRNPAERLWSHIKFHYQIDNSNFNFASQSPKNWKHMASVKGIKPYGDYVRTVRRMRSELEQHELMFQFFEDVRSNPLESLREIETFLGISNFEFSETRMSNVVNASADVEMPKSFRDFAVAMHDKQTKGLEDLGLSPPRSWFVD